MQLKPWCAIGILALTVLGMGLIAWHLSIESASATGASLQDEQVANPQAETAEIHPGPVSIQNVSRPTDRSMVGAKAFTLRSKQPVYDGPADEYVDSLLLASESGDAAATYLIYLRVSSCRRTLSVNVQSDLPAYASMGMAGAYLDSQELALEQCSKLIGNEDLSDRNWLSKAAEQGSLDARIMYATDVQSALGEHVNPIADTEKIATYKANAMTYLLAAAAEGSVDALFSLSNAYENGILVERDLISSHAYDLVLHRINPTYVADETLNETREKLSRDQGRASALLAEQLYRQCCIKEQKRIRS